MLPPFPAPRSRWCWSSFHRCQTCWFLQNTYWNQSYFASLPVTRSCRWISTTRWESGMVEEIYREFLYQCQSKRKSTSILSRLCFFATGKWVFPKIGVFHYKPSILGYPYFWKHTNHGKTNLESLGFWTFKCFTARYSTGVGILSFAWPWQWKNLSELFSMFCLLANLQTCISCEPWRNSKPWAGVQKCGCFFFVPHKNQHHEGGNRWKASNTNLPSRWWQKANPRDPITERLTQPSWTLNKKPFERLAIG